MNLTNDIRQAILACVLADIPRVHSLNLDERLQAVIDEDIAKSAPAALAAMWASPDLREWANTTRTHCGYLVKDDQGRNSYINSLSRFHVSLPQRKYGATYELSKAGAKKFAQLVNKAREEADRIEDAERKLKAAFAGVRTVKQFKQAFPELAKYAPAEAAKSTMLPAIANVIADLSKLGWPKEEKAAA